MCVDICVDMCVDICVDMCRYGGGSSWYVLYPPHPAAPGCDDGLHPSGPLASCQTPETDLALTRQLQGWTTGHL